MAVGESAGTVYVVIDGDASPLLAKYAQAETESRASGQKIAQSFTAAASRVEPLTVAINRVIGVLRNEGEATRDTIAALGSLASATNAVTTATTTVTAATQRATAAQGAHGAALAGSTNQARMLGSELRVLEGQQGILAAERFLATIPGVAAISTVLFPLFGALAVGEIAFRGLSKIFSSSAEEEKKLVEETGKLDDDIKQLSSSIDSIDAEKLKVVFGEGAAQGERLAATSSKAKEQILSLPIAFAGVAAQLVKMQGLQEGMGLNLSSLETSGHQTMRQPLQEPAQIETALKAVDAAAARAGNGMSSHFRAALKELEPLRLELQKAQTEAEKTQHTASGQGVSILTDSHSGYLKALQGEGEISAINAKGEQKAAEDKAAATLSATKAQIAASHDLRQARIDDEEDAGTRDIASAEERVTVARQTATAEIAYQAAITKAKIDGINAVSVAESRGKSGPETEKISATAQVDTQAAQREGLEKQVEAVRTADAVENSIGIAHAVAERGWSVEVTRVWEQSSEKRREETRRRATEEIEYEARVAEVRARVAEIQQKSAGDVKALQIKGQEIALEAGYGQQIMKTGADRVAMLKEVAALEKQATDAKISGLQADLATASAMTGTPRDETRIAELTAQIDAAKQEGANQQISANANIDAAKNQNNLGYQVGQDISKAILQSLPQALGSSLANALFDHRKGDSAGKQVGDAVKNVGKDLAGQIMTQAIEKLIATIVVQTGLQAAFNAIFPVSTTTQVVALSANTIASGVNTGALGLLTAVLLATAGFADGTSSAPGGWSVVGEKGPELMNVPQGAQIIPNHAIHKYANGTPGYSRGYQSSAFNTANTTINFHAHGVNDPITMTRMVMRALPDQLRLGSPQWASLSH